MGPWRAPPLPDGLQLRHCSKEIPKSDHATHPPRLPTPRLRNLGLVRTDCVTWWSHGF